jgi:hypothetical protein
MRTGEKRLTSVRSEPVKLIVAFGASYRRMLVTEGIRRQRFELAI